MNIIKSFLRFKTTGGGTVKLSFAKLSRTLTNLGRVDFGEQLKKKPHD